MSILAKHPGTCGRCGGPILKGDRVQHERALGGWVHTYPADCDKARPATTVRAAA